MIYKRVIIKISGEALAGGKHTGYDFDFVTSVCLAVKKCLENGLCVSTAGTKAVRFLPPLVLTEEQALAGLAIFKKVLESV